AANGAELHGMFELTIDFSTEPSLGAGMITWDDMGTGRFADASGTVAISTLSFEDGSLSFVAEGSVCY
ncbi:MAG: hypothetical protein V3S24_18205, partial [Candidatus Tectomicrobia bacterium]